VVQLSGAGRKNIQKALLMKNQEKVKDLFAQFLGGYDAEQKDEIWESHSLKFQDFWNNKIMPSKKEDLIDAEVDEIIRILDRNGKGNRKGCEAVAKVMIPQGAWRRMFNEIKNSPLMSKALNNAFIESDLLRKAASIDKVYKLNANNKNNLTGKSGTAISAMLVAWNPMSNLSAVSLNDKKKLYDYFEFDNPPDFEKDTIGTQIIKTNEDILLEFKSIGVSESARTITRFFYSPEIRALWKSKEDRKEPEQEDEGEDIQPNDKSLFYLEKHLEDFLIDNWDKTELGKKYDLYTEDGELKSQQYRTEIGIIDILAKDKKSDQLVVIELKKNQSSDDTIGQLARYMGWLEENKTGGKPTKGIIIAAQYDQRLYYALKKMKDAEVYLYQVEFHLKEHLSSDHKKN